MDFRPNEDQLALRDGVRAFCEGRVPVEALAELEDKRAFDVGLWSELAELGVFGLCLPEAQGGVGLGSADAVLVFAELGRRLVPGPILWTHLAAPFVEGAAAGEVVVGGLDVQGGEEPLLIEHLESLHALLLLRPDGIFRVDPKTIDAASVALPLDPLTPLHHAASLPAGERVADAEAATRLARHGTILASSLLLGIAEATLELAVAFAKQREQFGRPIGSFQSIKHLLADAFVRQEVARAAVYAAGATEDDPVVGDPECAASTAKLCAGEAAMKNARLCIQVHGGMGYTWEVPAHYYLKRTWVLENVFGSAEEHAERRLAAFGN